jgi:hypothetical protein
MGRQILNTADECAQPCCGMLARAHFSEQPPAQPTLSGRRKREKHKKCALVVDIAEKQNDPSAHLVRIVLGPFNDAA